MLDSPLVLAQLVLHHLTVDIHLLLLRARVGVLGRVERVGSHCLKVDVCVFRKVQEESVLDARCLCDKKSIDV